VGKSADILEPARKLIREFADEYGLECTFNGAQVASSRKEADPNSIKTRRGEFYPYVRDGYVSCGIRRKSSACKAHLQTNQESYIKRELVKYLQANA